jgi:hypothetical protein
VYSDVILDAVKQTPPDAELTPIELPEEYMKQAGDHARRRKIVAGIRLAVHLKATMTPISQR